MQFRGVRILASEGRIDHGADLVQVARAGFSGSSPGHKADEAGVREVVGMCVEAEITVGRPHYRRCRIPEQPLLGFPNVDRVSRIVTRRKHRPVRLQREDCVQE